MDCTTGICSIIGEIAIFNIAGMHVNCTAKTVVVYCIIINKITFWNIAVVHVNCTAPIMAGCCVIVSKITICYCMFWIWITEVKCTTHIRYIVTCESRICYCTSAFEVNCTSIFSGVICEITIFNSTWTVEVNCSAIIIIVGIFYS